MTKKFRYEGWRYCGNHPNGHDSISLDERVDVLKMVGIKADEEGENVYMLDSRLHEAAERDFYGIVINGWLIKMRSKSWGDSDFGYSFSQTYSVQKYTPPMELKRI